jgi:hypothetical protein
MFAQIISALIFAVVTSVGAQTPEGGAKLLHSWQAPMPVGKADAYFTNLASGDRIETPFLLKFGLSGGWGLAPITKAQKGKSGHHHLLVNRDLPLDFKAALPFNDQYIHFGKGQMEMVLTLDPGTYTLRMLLADDKHLPHFVYSKPLKVTVTRKTSMDPKSLVKPRVSLMLEGSEMKPPFRVQFHATGLQVAHLAQQLKDTGHFKLTMTNKSGAVAEMDFVDGQTETWLSPPAGDYTLRLDFVDNLNPSQVKTAAATATVKVKP